MSSQLFDVTKASSRLCDVTKRRHKSEIVWNRNLRVVAVQGATEQSGHDQRMDAPPLGRPDSTRPVPADQPEPGEHLPIPVRVRRRRPGLAQLSQNRREGKHEKRARGIVFCCEALFAKVERTDNSSEVLSPIVAWVPFSFCQITAFLYPPFLIFRKIIINFRKSRLFLQPEKDLINLEDTWTPPVMSSSSPFRVTHTCCWRHILQAISGKEKIRSDKDTVTWTLRRALYFL